MDERQSHAVAAPLPPDWPPGNRGWMVGSIAVGAGLLAAVIVALAVGRGAAGALVGAAFVLGFWSLAWGLSMWPGGRRDRGRFEVLVTSDRRERGIAFPYSFPRVASSLVAPVPFCVFVPYMTITELVDIPGFIALLARVAFIAIPALALAATVVMIVYHGPGRHWRVVLTPSVVALALGERTVWAPWDEVETVEALDPPANGPGRPFIELRGRPREPFIGLRVSSPDAVKGAALLRRRVRMAGLGDRTGVGLDVDMLAADPRALYSALAYYLRHPGARAELATDAGLARVRGRGATAE